MRVGFLCSVVRREEKLLLAEFERRKGVEVVRIDEEQLCFDLSSGQAPEVDIVLARSISFSRGLAAVRLLESYGVRCTNTADVISTCGSKLETSLALKAQEIAQPRVRIALSADAALETIEEMGYPVVLKPVVGSWGRLISKISDRDTAETVLEHRVALGINHAHVFYIQDYVETGGRDVRAFVVGEACIAAISRTSDHWITNTARGGQADVLPVTSNLAAMSVAAARAVGGGIVAVDLFQTKNGWLVNEVNHSMEFRNSIEPTGVNIPGVIVDHVLSTGGR